MVIENVKYVKDNGAQIITDNDLCFVIDDTLVVSLSLAKGMEIDDALLETLDKESKRHFAKVKAFSSLSRGDFSRKGLARRLCEKGADREAADEISHLMAEKGYVNDLEYAKRLCRTYSMEKHFGKRRVMQELFVRGIDGDTARRVTEETAIPDRDNIMMLFEAKYAKMDVSEPKCRNKVANALMRAGYDWEDIRVCLSDF